MEREREGKEDTRKKAGRRRKKEKDRETRRKGREKFQVIPKVQAVISRQEKCSASEIATRQTASVDRSPVRGALCVGQRAGSDTQAHWLCPIPHSK